MDWKGQKLAEVVMQYMLILFGAISFLTGYATADFRLMMYVFAAGVALTLLVVVIDWPFYNRNPLSWIDRKTAEAIVSRESSKKSANPASGKK